LRQSRARRGRGQPGPVTRRRDGPHDQAARRASVLKPTPTAASRCGRARPAARRGTRSPCASRWRRRTAGVRLRPAGGARREVVVEQAGEDLPERDVDTVGDEPHEELGEPLAATGVSPNSTTSGSRRSTRGRSCRRSRASAGRRRTGRDRLDRPTLVSIIQAILSWCSIERSGRRRRSPAPAWHTGHGA
jgi:hypothetical protein